MFRYFGALIFMALMLLPTSIWAFCGYASNSIFLLSPSREIAFNVGGVPLLEPATEFLVERIADGHQTSVDYDVVESNVAGIWLIRPIDWEVGNFYRVELINPGRHAVTTVQVEEAWPFNEVSMDIGNFRNGYMQDPNPYQAYDFYFGVDRPEGSDGWLYLVAQAVVDGEPFGPQCYVLGLSEFIKASCGGELLPEYLPGGITYDVSLKVTMIRGETRLATNSVPANFDCLLLDFNNNAIFYETNNAQTHNTETNNAGTNHTRATDSGNSSAAADDGCSSVTGHVEALGVLILLGFLRRFTC